MRDFILSHCSVVASGDTGRKLADKFTQVACFLRSMFDANPNADSQHNWACRLNIQLQDIVADIRKLPGLSRFLQPPLFSDLRVAAASGPVIIVNASQYGCDALVLPFDQDPVHVALPITKAHVFDQTIIGTSFYDVTRQIRGCDEGHFGPSTRTLGRSRFPDRENPPTVLSPSITHLVVPDSRVLSSPIARCRLVQEGPTDALRSLYFLLYTDLTALIRARQKSSLDPYMEQHRFLIIGQAQAAGLNPLASVNTELSSISQHVESVATLTRIQDQDASITKVSEELNKNHFVHSACHGVLDRKQPFESGFSLGDGLLKIENIMQYDLQNARFAYLSACHTTVSDEESPDEVIHLAAAMQFAGFRSVIGTMWAVDDAHTNEITSIFYDNLMDESGRLDHTRAALTLHKAMMSIRSSDIPLDQRILYIHIGA